MLAGTYLSVSAYEKKKSCAALAFRAVSPQERGCEAKAAIDVDACYGPLRRASTKPTHLDFSTCISTFLGHRAPDEQGLGRMPIINTPSLCIIQ